jgi:hypothetical protein
VEQIIRPNLLNEKEAAELLHVSVSALRRWRRERRGPGFARIEGCVRYDMRAIELFLAEHSSPGSDNNEIETGAYSGRHNVRSTLQV